MEPIHFIYWLRGFLEIAEPRKIRQPEIDIINEHLDLVLTPVTKKPISIREHIEREHLIPQFSEVKGLKHQQPTPAELDEALGTVNRWYPPSPYVLNTEGVYGSC